MDFLVCGMEHQPFTACMMIPSPGCWWPSPRRAEASLFIAMRATDPLQDLLYFVRDPWPWGKPHEAAGIPGVSRQQCSRMAARGARAARRAVKRIEVL